MATCSIIIAAIPHQPLWPCVFMSGNTLLALFIQKGVNITGFEEKPVFRNHINAGVYVLDPKVLDMLKNDERCDMPTLFNRLQGCDKKTIVYPIHEPWLDVGHVDDLKRAQKDHQKNS